MVSRPVQRDGPVEPDGARSATDATQPERLTMDASRMAWISLSSRILPFQSFVFLLTRAE